MSVIEVLDNNTIDKIAAGEVVERPASVVKELVENAMDSEATAITVEIKNGGIEFIRVTDNGMGMFKEDIPKAFLRHATSKIRKIEDLSTVTSMGFRGEALASIASVSKIELITKRRDDLMGIRYITEGGTEKELEEIGAPDGTTIIVRNLFYNTPVRRKFLRSESAEGGYILDIMQQLALCRPDISFHFISNGKTKFSTTGNKDEKEIIYRLYGREVINEIVPIFYEEDGCVVQGYLGTPAICRANRNFETYFLNRRFIQSDVVSKSIEEGYRAYLMQHKFPFCVLHISMDTKELDVNVHPAKLEVRFHNRQQFHDFMVRAITDTLAAKEMIPGFSLEENEQKITEAERNAQKIPQPFEAKRLGREEIPKKEENDISAISFFSEPEVNVTDITEKNEKNDKIFINKILQPVAAPPTPEKLKENIIKEKDHILVEKPTQLRLFEEERVLSPKARSEYKILGQVFDTYWIITYGDSLYFVDQHAAHEKVNFERMMARVQAKEVSSQQLNPPVVVTLSGAEAAVVKENMHYFLELGFEIESFGGNEYALRAIPLELYSNTPEQMFLETLSELSQSGAGKTPEVIMNRIATMACKASVKGNNRMSVAEMETLLDELLTLENPYHCPHGRPTIFSMSKYELEKKFKRIVT